jgi:hypothetical protein
MYNITIEEINKMIAYYDKNIIKNEYDLDFQ